MAARSVGTAETDYETTQFHYLQFGSKYMITYIMQMLFTTPDPLRKCVCGGSGQETNLILTSSSDPNPNPNYNSYHNLTLTPNHDLNPNHNLNPNHDLNPKP